MAEHLPARYRVLWDNGKACDTFAEEFDTHDEAHRAGEDWRLHMIAHDDDPEEAAEAYTFEIIEDHGPDCPACKE